MYNSMSMMFMAAIIAFVLLVAFLLYKRIAKHKANKTTETMQKCTSCGSVQPKDLKFCEKCGTSLTNN